MATTNFTPLLGFALPTTGDLTSTWGDAVNNSITSLIDSAIAGTATISTDVDVTLTTTQGADNQARTAVLNCTGARTAARNITAPAQSKAYVVLNATTGGYAVTLRGVGPTTGVSIANGKRALCAWNGLDFVVVVSNDINLASEVTGTLPEANGGTGETTYSNGQLLVGNAANGLTKATLTGGSSINITNGDGSITIDSTAVTTASVVSANGFAGSVATATTTPAITVSTTVTGMVKGNGTALSAATAGTDYSGGTSALSTGIVKSTTGTGNLTIAAAGTDYVSPTGAETVTNKTLTGPRETFATSASGISGATGVDVLSGSDMLYTTNAAGNYSLNIRGDGSTTLASLLAVGQSATVAVGVPNGGTAYYCTAITIDGSSTNVTTKWANGTAPTAGNASATDYYTVNVKKTAATSPPTYAVFASVQKFA